MKIYKYDLGVKDIGQRVVSLPKDYKIIHVDKQENSLYLWALVDLQKPIFSFVFDVIGTGQLVNKDGYFRQHIGTVMDGLYVWHVFDKNQIVEE